MTATRKPSTPLRRVPDVIEQLTNDRARLVDALRDAREGMRRALNPVGGDAKCAEIMRIDALLAELGE